MNSIEIKTIDDAFEVYRMLISSSELCESNQKLLSNFAYQIDAYALATILNFFNNYPEIVRLGERWKSNLLVIRMFSLVTSEIISFLHLDGHIDKDSFDKPNNLDDIFALRNKIHQFRNCDFKNNIAGIDSAMGRSRDRLAPHLDVCLEYSGDKKNKHLFGTNIYQYHFSEANEQLTVDFMQKIIRAVEKQTFYPSSNFKIKGSRFSPKYRWEVYCYTDIVKNTKLQSERVIDRVLLAFDDLCCILDFFEFTIQTDTYLATAPYLLFFLCKMVAIILDETFDNFKKYIDRSPNDSDGVILQGIMAGIDYDFIDYCRRVRNNLHYQKQTTVLIKTAEEQYDFLQKELDMIQLLLDRIRIILNINPSPLKFKLYRFLRWVQMPN